MCNMVGADFKKIDFKNKDDLWFDKYSWTEKQEDDFKKWLHNYLYKNNEAQRELYNRTRMRKWGRLSCEEAVTNFVFQYSWRYKK